MNCGKLFLLSTFCGKFSTYEKNFMVIEDIINTDKKSDIKK